MNIEQCCYSKSCKEKFLVKCESCYSKFCKTHIFTNQKGEFLPEENICMECLLKIFDEKVGYEKKNSTK